MKTITFKTSSTIILLCAALTCANPSAAQEHAAAAVTSGALRIGIFDTRGVAMAYAGSARPDCMMAKVAELRTEHERANEEGNENRATELEAEVVALQEKIHKQVFSGARIDDILALLEDDLPEVAKAANVKLIVSGVLHSRPGLELVDITQEICALFGPDEETRKAIVEIMAQPLVDESELSHDR